jgi:hypothetical protein
MRFAWNMAGLWRERLTTAYRHHRLMSARRYNPGRYRGGPLHAAWYALGDATSAVIAGVTYRLAADRWEREHPEGP